MAGKGDRPRPVDKNQYDKNYEAIFSNKKKTCEDKKCRRVGK